MARILWEAESGTLSSQQHIIDKLREEGHTVYANDGEYGRFHSQDYFNKHNDAKYHFAIYTLHTGNPVVTKFVQTLSCQRKFIIVHDIFGDIVEGGEVSWNNVELITFTKKHEQFAKRNGVCNTRQARWYKLDMSLPTALPAHSPNFFHNAIVVDSVVFSRNTIFKYKDLFKDVFVKRWNDLEYIHTEGKKHIETYVPDSLDIFGCKAPRALIGMQGMLYSSRLGAFWFVRESSLIVEALMVGCIPILYDGPKYEFKDFPYLLKDEPVTSVVSSVEINIRINEYSVVKYPMLGVTCNNLEKKLQLLQNPAIYKETLELLSKEWLFDTPISELPSVEDILLEHIK